MHLIRIQWRPRSNRADRILESVSRIIERIAGILLLVVGLLLLFSEPLMDFIRGLGVGDELLRWWPVLLIGLSLFFLVPSLLGGPNRRLRAGMVIPGALMAGVGGALLYTSLTDRWGAWAYLWAVLPVQLRARDVRGRLDRRRTRLQVDRRWNRGWAASWPTSSSPPRSAGRRSG